MPLEAGGRFALSRTTRHANCPLIGYSTVHQPNMEESMPYVQKGDVRIRYEEAGSGFPLLVTPGGGLNSRLSNWQTAVVDWFDVLKDEFRVITMDQRNANQGESTGPIPSSDPWGAFADDQLAVMDHLGIDKFMMIGCCIGGPFVLKMMERAPGRIVAGVLCQPVGSRPEDPDVMLRSGQNIWAPELLPSRPDLTQAQVDQYLHDLYSVNSDFVYSVSRDFVHGCQTPMLVMPDEVPAHPYYISMEVFKLAPNAEVTIYPWKETPETKEKAAGQVRAFLKARVPAR